jgi:tRNA pseudouridine55 synthase
MNGVLVINKPVGLTSTRIVARIKRILKAKKVGHAGTLDPLASGVLVVCINDATKLASTFLNDDKEYLFQIKLGEETVTHDAESKVIRVNALPENIDKMLSEVLKEFHGEIEQMPPVHSALKINGQPAYKLARRGVDVQLKSRRIKIESLTVSDMSLPFVRLQVVCSKGTYVRSLARDIGLKLGCGGYVTELIRLRSGRFRIEDALSMDVVLEPGFYENVNKYLAKL